MNHVITTYGGGELFTLVFNGIAALFRTDHTGLVMTLIRVGLTVGSVYVVILMLFKNQVIEGFKWFLWVLVATNLLFLPKTTVFIHDPLCNTKHKIDHVPFALGAFASLVSQVGRAITEQFEAVFTLPDYMPYHKTGTVFASALMAQVGQFRIVDPVFKGNMERFVNQCVVYDAMIGHKYTLDDLQKTNDIWELVTQNASPVLGFLYKTADNPGTVVTCREGATALSRLWAEQIAKATAVYGTRVNNRTLTASAFNSDILSGAKLLSGSLALANSATDLLRQEMMINAIEEASNNKLSELGSASNYAATKALLQQRSAYAAAGEIAARTLPLFKNVIEALSYALFIFIVILVLLPNGYRTVLTYCGILAWTQLWEPLYAVLNLIMTLYGKHESMGHGLQNGLTLLNSSAIINANADMVTLAAWLSVSIPFISYGILKQGAAAFVGLAQHLGSAMQSAASSAAAETVSGNISMGNVSLGTQAYQNTSAFQHNTSPSYTASQFRALSPAGIERSSFADGTQSLSNQALSRLSVQIMGSENTSYAQQEHLNSAMSVLQSKSIASSQATEASLQDTTNFVSSVGKSISSGQDFHQGMSASDSKTLQNFKNFVSDIQKSTGLNETQSVDAALAISAGTPKVFGFGAEMRGSFASAAARNQAIHAAESVAQQSNYSENFDKVISASQNYSEAHNNTKNTELGHSAAASLNKAKSLREETALAQNKVDTLSKDISSSHGKSLSINKDLTQGVLDFIAHQPVNAGPQGDSGGQIGHERARQILENGGAKRDSYLQRFQEENPQYSIQSINSAQGMEPLTAKFESQAAIFKNQEQPGVGFQNSQDIQNILDRGHREGLHPTEVPTSKQSAITNSINLQGEKINQGKEVIDQNETLLQTAEEASKDKNMTASMGKNILKSIAQEGSLASQWLSEAPLPLQKLPFKEQNPQAFNLQPPSSYPEAEISSGEDTSRRGGTLKSRGQVSEPQQVHKYSESIITQDVHQAVQHQLKTTPLSERIKTTTSLPNPTLKKIQKEGEPQKQSEILEESTASKIRS